jgi:TIR domain
MTSEEAAIEIGSALELMRNLTSQLRKLADYEAKKQAIPLELQIEYAEIAEVDRQSELVLRKCRPLIGDDLVADWIPGTMQQLKITFAEGLCTHFQEKKVILERALAKLELTVVRTPFGSTSTPGVFLSHNWNDKWFVRKLAAELQAYDIRVWLDEAELKIGDSLIAKVHEALGRAKYVVGVISKSSVKSHWVQQELQTAMSMQIATGEMRILPIVIEDVGDEMPIYLRDKLYGDFRDPGSFYESVMKLAASMNAAKSATELINTLPPEDSVTEVRRCKLREVRDGRRVLRSLSTHPAMDIPENRRALLWHGFYQLLDGNYTFDLVVGKDYSTDTDDFHFRGWDTLAFKNMSRRLTSKQADRGVWEFTFFPVDQDWEDEFPSSEQRPISSADQFVTSKYLGHNWSEPTCPTSSRAEEQIEPLMELVRHYCKDFGSATKRSLLLDLQHIALAKHDRVVTYRVGKINLLQCSTFKPKGGMTTDRLTCGNKGAGTLYFQISDSFLQSVNSLYLCQVHQKQVWDVEVNLLQSNHHCMVLGLH